MDVNSTRPLVIHSVNQLINQSINHSIGQSEKRVWWRMHTDKKFCVASDHPCTVSSSLERANHNSSFIFLWQESEDSDIYASIQELRDQSDTLTQQMENLELAGDRDNASAVKQQLELTQERLLAKNRERELRK